MSVFWLFNPFILSNQLSFKLLMLAPLLSMESTNSNKSLVLRLSFVNSVIIAVSPSLKLSKSLLSCGRFFLVPVIFYANIGTVSFGTIFGTTLFDF